MVQLSGRCCPTIKADFGVRRLYQAVKWQHGLIKVIFAQTCMRENVSWWTSNARTLIIPIINHKSFAAPAPSWVRLHSTYTTVYWKCSALRFYRHASNVVGNYFIMQFILFKKKVHTGGFSSLTTNLFITQTHLHESCSKQLQLH